MPSLIIFRERACNAFMFFSIRIDGQTIGMIGDGETKTFEIPSGIHALNAYTSTGIRSLTETYTVTISGGEEKKLRIRYIGPPPETVNKSILPCLFPVVMLFSKSSRKAFGECLGATFKKPYQFEEM